VVRIVKREIRFGLHSDGSSFFPYKLILINGESFNIKEEDMNMLMEHKIGEDQ
jgi:hypothetical protein